MVEHTGVAAFLGRNRILEACACRKVSWILLELRTPGTQVLVKCGGSGGKELDMIDLMNASKARLRALSNSIPDLNGEGNTTDTEAEASLNPSAMAPDSGNAPVSDETTDT